ncbi:MAG: uracil-DNA glycosylase [Elusimicrobiota bacterium]|jgi:DNA polymerase|nr:uracil-DNA glycosylase [Elusimicrobiota bacterium]
MKKEIRNLAGDLKKLISAGSEEDFMIPAKPARADAAAAVSAEPVLQPAPPQITKPQTAAPATATEPAESYTLESIAKQILSCQRCALGATRIKAVPGEGNPKARLMFIGEGPGYEEDRQGRPFVGKAGQLLDKIIAAMGFKREEVFIANMVKCHPMIDPQDPEKRGNDRAPVPDEIALCRGYVERQINAVGPDYIVALGGVAAKSLIRDAKSLSAIRGKIYDLELSSVQLAKPVKILATYHPAALLRNPGWKKDTWADLKILLADMGRTPPSAV